jgi:uncharacterized protein involved in exopolysaccharide biosynthesis
MGRPVKKVHAPDDERVATFRITHGKLTAFQEECQRRGFSVSQALIGFIDSVIDGGEVPAPLTTETALEKRVAEIEGELKNIPDPAPEIESLRSEMESLRGEIDSLKKSSLSAA